MTYINIKEYGEVETLEQFESRKEARQVLNEYRCSNEWYANAYLSSRCTKDWKNKD